MRMKALGAKPSDRSGLRRLAERQAQAQHQAAAGGGAAAGSRAGEIGVRRAQSDAIGIMVSLLVRSIARPA